MVWGVRNLRGMISTAPAAQPPKGGGVALLMFLDEFHAALGALARHVLNYFRVHCASVLYNFVGLIGLAGLAGLGVALFLPGLVAAGHGGNGKGEQCDCGERRKFVGCFHSAFHVWGLLSCFVEPADRATDARAGTPAEETCHHTNKSQSANFISRASCFCAIKMFVRASMRDTGALVPAHCASGWLIGLMLLKRGRWK